MKVRFVLAALFLALASAACTTSPTLPDRRPAGAPVQDEVPAPKDSTAAGGGTMGTGT
jgi:hypothetical protein